MHATLGNEYMSTGKKRGLYKVAPSRSHCIAWVYPMRPVPFELVRAKPGLDRARERLASESKLVHDTSNSLAEDSLRGDSLTPGFARGLSLHRNITTQGKPAQQDICLELRGGASTNHNAKDADIRYITNELIMMRNAGFVNVTTRNFYVPIGLAKERGVEDVVNPSDSHSLSKTFVAHPIPDMTPLMRIGQNLKGRFGIYSLAEKLHKDIWTAHTKNATVIVKTAPKLRLDNEHQVLQRFHERPHIRQLIDVIEQPPAIVLEHFDDNLLHASNSKKLERVDVKLVARSILEALKLLHEDGFVHTDVKPDNILVNYAADNNSESRFRDVALGDCGDVYRVDLNADPRDMFKEDGHIIGAAIFRSPEAMLNLRWGTATDIWSFGTTLISLIWGNNWHIFKPDEVTIDDEAYPAHVLIKQADYFGPFPPSYHEITDEERLATLTFINNYSTESGKWKPFELAEDPELTKTDRDFLCKIMRIIPPVTGASKIGFLANSINFPSGTTPTRTTSRHIAIKTFLRVLDTKKREGDENGQATPFEVAPSASTSKRAVRRPLVCENNPEVMSSLVHKLGLSTALSFHDVFSIEDPDLLAFVPRPASALLLVFPVSKSYETFRIKEDADRLEYTGLGEQEPVIWYKQTIRNACGLIGILHAVSNGNARDFIESGSDLFKLVRDAIPLPPIERADLLYNSQALENAHQSAAAEGQSHAPDAADDIDLHYVCFVKDEKNRLWEMDGRRKGPLDRGQLDVDEDVLSERALDLGPRMFLKREAETGGGELRFSLITLAPGMD
ncbi:hypothetical protein B7494_g4876 [Chlorociboria aeruginascens]|nr:hypothetical protein B7494_g4876 [Chlorociboria aeruginascens]